MMKSLLSALAVFTLGASLALAQDYPGSTPTPTPSPTPGKIPIWQASLPGGTYAVRVSFMTSVSMHEYLVDGAAKVTEVNIGTVGSDLVRFYYIEPNVPQTPDGIGQGTLNAVQDRANQLLNRAQVGDNLQKVVKNYPTTTHAHTVEYRLASRDALQKLFESAQKSFLTSTSGSYPGK